MGGPLEDVVAEGPAGTGVVETLAAAMSGGAQAAGGAAEPFLAAVVTRETADAFELRWEAALARGGLDRAAARARVAGRHELGDWPYPPLDEAGAAEAAVLRAALAESPA